MKTSRPRVFLFIGIVLIAHSVLLLEISLTDFFIYTWLSLGRVYVLTIYPFLKGCPVYKHIVVHNSLLYFLACL